MKSRLILSCVAGLLGSLAISAQATPVYITDIINKNTTSNPSCTIAVQSGMSYSYYTYVGYNVTCGSTVIGLTLTYNSMFGSCSVGGNPSYTFTGSCDNYSIYRN